MTQNPDPTGSTSRWPWAVGTVVAIAVLGLIGWAVFGGSGSDTPEDTAATTAPTSQVTESPASEPSASGETPDTVVPTGEPTAVATDPAGERSVLDDVAPREAAQPSKDVTIRIVKVENVRSKVVLPEDTAGPALRLTIRVTNDGSKLLDTRFAVVNAYYGSDRTPANPFSQPGGRALPPSIAPGSSANAVYLFGVPRKERDNVTVEVDLAPQLPVSYFVGAFR